MAGDDHADQPDAGQRDPDGLLARAGASGDPDQDQHFLVDDRVLDRIPTYAVEANVDLAHVLEIGAGNGALTDRLLAVADRVTAVECDPDLAAFLRTEFAEAIEEERLTVIEGDALEVDFPDYTASISNLPYGASSEILFRLLPDGKPLIAMVQAEFADRMAADPGSDNYGRLSVTAGHYADVEVVEPVPPEAFSPPPAVESALVRALAREPNYTVPDDEFFLSFVKAVFTQRRKTVRNGIRNTAHISGLDEPDAVVEAADEALLRKRAGKLSPVEFAELATLAYEVGLDSDD